MTALDDRTADLSRELAAVETTLTGEFPAIDPARVHDYVDQAYRGLLPAKVTTFLPIFVARQARDQLRRELASAQPGDTAAVTTRTS